MRGFNIKPQEDHKMKTFNAIIFIALLFGATACSTSSAVYDDVYYSRRGGNTPAVSQNESGLATAPAKTYTAEAVSSNTDYDYQAYYQDDAAANVQQSSAEPVYQTSETVTETDGTTYTTTETYYDGEYANRIRRFGSSSSSNFGYYDAYNTGCYDCVNTNVSFGFGYPWGWSFGLSYGSPYYYGYNPYRPYYSSWRYYDPFFYDPWYAWGPSWGWGGSYYSGYNHGYWNGFYDGYYSGGGYGWYGNNRDRGSYRYYGHRSSIGGSTTNPSGSNRGYRSGDDTEKDSYVSGRGARSSSAGGGAIEKTSPVTGRDNATATDRGQSARGQNTERAVRPSSNNEVRSERPANNDRFSRPNTNNQETRPSATEKVSEFRSRYERPTQSRQEPAAREQRYERPKTYTSPSDKQPRSSSEYVRPQRETRNTNVNSSRSNNVRTQPAPSRSNSTTVTPSRSNSTRSYSTPSRSTTRSSSGSYSAPSRSSSSGSSSSGSSRGSSSSSSGSSRGGRR